MSEDKKTIVKMAHIYSQEGRWDKAIAEYKKLIKIDPEDFNSYSMLGDVFVKKGELQPAFDAYLVCSDAYIRLGQLEKAALVQSKIARLNADALSPDSRKKQVLFTKQVEGDKAMEAGELDVAITAYQSVLEMDPDRFDLYQKLGDLYLRKGETEAACRKYLEIGDIYFKNKLIKKAAPIYLKVVELDPENVDAHAALAEIQAKSGNESEAKKELLLLAEFLFQRGDLERAYQFAQKGEQLKSIESYNYLGHVEFRRGKKAEAKAWFEKLLKFKLNHGGALWGLGLVQEDAGQLDEAMKTWAKVPKTDRFYGEAIGAMAGVYEKQGKQPEALQNYQDSAAALRSKGAVEQAKVVADHASRLLGAQVSAPAAPAEAVAPAMPPPIAAAPTAPPPLAPIVSPAPPTVPPPLPVLVSTPSAPPPLPAFTPSAPIAPPELPVFAETAPEPEAEGDDAETLLALADNFEGEGAYDEAIGVYQRVLDQDPGHAKAKEALGRVYGLVARGAMGTATSPGQGLAGGQGSSPEEQARMAAAEIARARADEDAKLAAQQARTEAERRQSEELTKLAAQRAQAEADRRQADEDAKRRAEELAKAEAQAKQAGEDRAKAEAEAKRLSEEKNASEKAAHARAEAEVKMRAETEARLRVEIEARQRAEAEAKRHAEEAGRATDDMRKRLEAEIRAQLEGEMRKQMEEDARARADQEVQRKVDEARRLADDEARKANESAIRTQFEEEKKKLEHEKAEVKRRMEDELRQRITSEVQHKQEAETERKVEAVRAVAEDAARQKIQSEVLARVQAQQKEKLAPLQRTIEEIRRKVEEQAAATQLSNAAAKAGAAPTAAPAAPSAPAAVPAVAAAAAKQVDEDLDDMDDFMTSAVADIYVKQGLIKEALRIYERILKREPGNADVKAKLEAVKAGKPLPSGAPAAAPAKPNAPVSDGSNIPAKKSKVSYL